MSLVVILLWLWWGLLGAAAVAVGVWGFVSVLGPTGRLVLLLLVGTVGGHLLDRHLHDDERCANEFLSAWAAESADFPEGRVNTRPWGEFADYDRLQNPNPYLAQHFRLLYHSPVTAAGHEEIATRGVESPVSAKVYLSDVRVHGSEQDVDLRAKLRVWVAKDTHRVAKFMFEDITFQ